MWVLRAILLGVLALGLMGASSPDAAVAVTAPPAAPRIASPASSPASKASPPSTGVSPSASATLPPASPRATAAPVRVASVVRVPATSQAPVPVPPAGTQFMRVCGVQFCFGSTPFYPYGATFYRSSPLSGIDNPRGAVGLAQLEGLNTMRVVNFYNPTSGDPAVTPFSSAVWDQVDTLIADAQAAGIRVVLDLADYRNILMDHCINPYTYDWSAFESFVAHRVNHVTGRVYADDPEIVMVSFSGEPLPVGQHGCISYTTQNLTDYFHAVTRTWKSFDHNHLVTSGGLGYLNFNSGIDWQAIDADPNTDVCAFKTYGGMMQWVHVGAAYCTGTLHKPWFNDEWGYQQSMGDLAMSNAFSAQFANNTANGAAANFFWNAGYQVASTTYDVGPQTPLTMAVVRANAHPLTP